MKTKPSFPKLLNDVSVKAESTPRLARLVDGKLKPNMTVNAWRHYVKVDVIESACKH